MGLHDRIKAAVKRRMHKTISEGRLKSIISRKTGCVFLMYHSTPKYKSEFAYATPETVFEQHCAVLEEFFDVVSINDAHEILSGVKKREVGRPIVVITFDDGYMNNYEVAYPILKRYQFPFSIFLTTNFIEATNTTFLSWPNVIQMSQDKLVTFGAHSVSHVNLKAIVDEDKVHEIVGSGEMISQKIGKEVDFFAYPSGGFEEKSLDIVADNYLLGFKDRANGADDMDSRKLARVSIDSHHNNMKAFLAQLAFSDFLVI
jgi:peptidoglycan/xylan/chitin deacetylase (PgdA/CDA1 family)